MPSFTKGMRGLLWLACLGSAVLTTGCVSGPSDTAYEIRFLSPYQHYRSLCVVPAEQHDDGLDLTLLRMLKDRGFEPTLLKPSDAEDIRRCRGIVTFSTKGEHRPMEAPSTMSLTFLDTYTGETYHVAVSQKTAPEAGLWRVNTMMNDPVSAIRQLVERLFPERTDAH